MRAAAVDIGTNSVRLLIVEAEAGAVDELHRQAIVTRLGEGVDRHGALQPDAIERTLLVLESYGSIMRDRGVELRRAVATSATRDAANAASFLQGAAERLGTPPDVIGGEEEALLSFAGAMSGRSEPSAAGGGNLLVVDVGGGSTEFVVGETAPVYACSVDIGSVRLTERHLGTQPASREAVAQARAHVAELFAAELTMPPIDHVIGVAGTFTTVAAMHLELTAYDRQLVHGASLGLNDFERIVDRLASMTLEDITAVPSMDPARAPVILGGAIVVEQALVVAGVDRVTVSETDILDGVVRSILDAAHSA